MWKGFLRRERPVLACNAAAILLFCILSFAYRIHREVPLYTILLLQVTLLIYEVFRFGAYRKKCRELQVLCDNAPSLLASLPEAEDGVEEAYQHLARLLDGRADRIRTEYSECMQTTDRYLTMWSHQIKTPIAGLRLLLTEETPDVAAMKKEVFSIGQYVESVLLYQRLQATENDLVVEACDIEAMVREALKEVSILLTGRKLSIHIESLTGTLITDQKWFVFVLAQLLENAIKYTKEGGISIGLSPDEQNRGEEDGRANRRTGVILTIEDTGIGIRTEDLPRIFEWGFTGYNGRIDKRATGIGLALVKQTLDMLGYTIAIESEVGAGTRVHLYLEVEV